MESSRVQRKIMERLGVEPWPRGCIAKALTTTPWTNFSFLGTAAKSYMVKSKLPNSVLGKIWKLSDVDRDGMLDADEFALANYLINLKLEGNEMPHELPAHLVPPSKRDLA